MKDRPYDAIAGIIRHLAAMPSPQPRLDQLAAQLGLSEFYFQRLFKEWAGVSPKKFLQHVTLEAARQRLAQSRSVLDASFDVGLSGPGRLHDLFVSLSAMTPGETKNGGRDLTIGYGFCHTLFGDALIAFTERGICALRFAVNSRDVALSELGAEWPNATFEHNQSKAEALGGCIFAEKPLQSGDRLAVVVPGTGFQYLVWKALLEIPPGHLCSYGDIAARLGMGGRGARAVGQAIGANPVAWLIPCHRVIRETGAVGGYRWGVERKLAMQGYEAALASQDRAANAGGSANP